MFVSQSFDSKKKLLADAKHLSRPNLFFPFYLYQPKTTIHKIKVLTVHCKILLSFIVWWQWRKKNKQLQRNLSLGLMRKAWFWNLLKLLLLLHGSHPRGTYLCFCVCVNFFFFFFFERETFFGFLILRVVGFLCVLVV